MPIDTTDHQANRRSARLGLVPETSLFSFHQFQENLHRLSGIGFEVGRQDSAHIITGARLFSQALTRNGIEYQYLQYEGDHLDQYEGDHKYGPGERIAMRVLPFFSEKLSFSRE